MALMSTTGRALSRQLSRSRPMTASKSSQRMLSTSATIRSASKGHDQIVDRVADFAKVQAKRPEFTPSVPITVTKSPNPDWTYGCGATPSASTGSSEHIEVDPYAPDRPMVSNYRLLVSGIAPRPVGFLSTVSKTGQKNLAPFSYFQVIDHDPPMFVVGFSSRPGRAKDTFANLKETGECVINTVSEDMVESMNATSIDAPVGVSEWDISGLTEASSSTVAASRVQESVFSIEAKVVDIKELGHAGEGLSVAATVLIQATRFWVRGDATNEDVSHIHIDKLRPVGQLGGKSYARITETFEVPRRKWVDVVGGSEVLRRLEEESIENERGGVRDTVEDAQEMKAGGTKA